MSYRISHDGFSLGDNPCSDKLAFLTEKEANAARVQADWEHDNKGLKAYLCDKCELYHLATNNDTKG